jgi:ABC-type amino acid transport system permease subunit
MAKTINLVNMGFGISVGIFSARIIFILVIMATLILTFTVFNTPRKRRYKTDKYIRTKHQLNTITITGISVALIVLIAAGKADGYMMRK